MATAFQSKLDWPQKFLIPVKFAFHGQAVSKEDTNFGAGKQPDFGAIKQLYNAGFTE